ncbi:unnamed protein product [Mytilus edulis]|uniref:Tyr recombinase domain-containing protein n=1 Tax=Mytilus edulis TaxID=6550 RepID=A0A8S3U4R4_MYTED|nr:unnamed protein product [Mytilus edulis]
MNDLSEDILQLEDIINSRDKEREATNAFLAEMRNGNTVRKTKSDVGKFKTWLNQQNEEREVESIPSPELDLFLARFFMTAKKGDGGEYEPDTLKSMQGSINRFLAEKGSLVNLIEVKEFKHSRDVLTSKKKYLRQQGKGNRPNQADPFTREEIDMLYQKGLLGNAQSLLNTVFLNNSMYFGMRSRTEHEHLRWGDVELKTTSSGNQRCPIQMYLLYAQKRPVNMKEDEAKFYVGINNKASSGEWFKNMAMGKNTIGKIVKTMAEEGGIEGRKVNHSARKTGITTLIHNGVQDTLVQQHSGHKSLASINNYSKASINQQREMSSVLTNFNKTVSVDSTITCFEDNFIPNDNEDQLLFRASQEIVETALNDIANYEIVQINSNTNTTTITPEVPIETISSTTADVNTFPNIDIAQGYRQQCSLPSILNNANIKGDVIINYMHPNEGQKENKKPNICKRKWVIYDTDSE